MKKELPEIIANPVDVGIRLDCFLKSRIPEFSRAQIGKLIKAGHVTQQGLPTKPAQMIAAGDHFLIKMPKKEAGLILPQAIPLEILFSDPHLAVINKPVGLTVHPGAGINDGTLCNALLHHFPDMVIGNAERPGIVHRLDKDTSGVMVVAKTAEAHRILSDDFKYRRVKKIYRAFCWNEIADNRLELKTGHMRHPYNRLKFFTKINVPKSPSTHVRMAHTDVEVISRGFGITEVKAQLHTGRTHQIRAHLADIGHPLLGDCLYGGKHHVKKSFPAELKLALESLTGQALFAASLEFFHPVTKELLLFSAPLPKPLLAISAALSSGTY